MDINCCRFNYKSESDDAASFQFVPFKKFRVRFWHEMATRASKGREMKGATLPTTCCVSRCLPGAALACRCDFIPQGGLLFRVGDSQRFSKPGEVSHAVQQRFFRLLCDCSRFGEGEKENKQSSGFLVKSTFFFKTLHVLSVFVL